MRSEMQNLEVASLGLPSPSSIRDHVLTALGGYWQNNPVSVGRLPIAQIEVNSIDGPLRLIEVELPKWASSCGINGFLLIPVEAANSNQKATVDWQCVDWWLATFLLLEAWHERVWEHQYGPIHSYSFHLKGWDQRAWQYAWVNRIGLFLRNWAANQSKSDTTLYLGVLPQSKVHLTHDVDAINKTTPIRIKQALFNLFNAMQSLRYGHFKRAAKQIQKATRFLVGREDWWVFERLQHLEAEAGIRATYHFHADCTPKTLKKWLFDPSYDVAAPKQQALLKQLIAEGHSIGLHPGFDAWQDAGKIAAQRSSVEQAAGVQVTHCRQHWLRFSWQATWSAQQSAGLTHDTTLMFNDRAGFRNSSALRWHPWQMEGNNKSHLVAMPSVFMDSHFYDYQYMSSAARRSAMQHWIQECHSVSGEAAILWHPHTLTGDYGWSGGFKDAIELIKESVICQ
jgi:hypothetical protein